MRRLNENATGGGGVNVGVGGHASTTKRKKAFKCGNNHITHVVQELRDMGVGLCGSATDTQLEMLPKALEYLGARGLNTYEGTAAGYCRLATRIQDLEERGYLIASHREDVYDQFGIFHKGIARYVLIGKRADAPPEPQLDLGLCEVMA